MDIGLVLGRAPLVEVVATHRESQTIYYSLANDDIKTMLHTLHHLFSEN